MGSATALFIRKVLWLESWPRKLRKVYWRPVLFSNRDAISGQRIPKRTRPPNAQRTPFLPEIAVAENAQPETISPRVEICQMEEFEKPEKICEIVKKKSNSPIVDAQKNSSAR
jgi:hypothetical protein